jgi:hypothetical protein
MATNKEMTNVCNTTDKGVTKNDQQDPNPFADVNVLEAFARHSVVHFIL